METLTEHLRDPVIHSRLCAYWQAYSKDGQKHKNFYRLRGRQSITS